MEAKVLVHSGHVNTIRCSLRLCCHTLYVHKHKKIVYLAVMIVCGFITGSHASVITLGGVGTGDKPGTAD